MAPLLGFFPFLCQQGLVSTASKLLLVLSVSLGLLTASQTSFQSGTGGIAKPLQEEQQGRRKKLQGMEMVLLVGWELVQPGGFGV